MSDWVWAETNLEPPARKIVAVRPAKGASYTFESADGKEWLATIIRATGHDPIEEPITWQHMMDLKKAMGV